MIMRQLTSRSAKIIRSTKAVLAAKELEPAAASATRPSSTSVAPPSTSTSSPIGGHCEQCLSQWQ